MPNAKEQLYDENRFLMNKTEAGFRKLLIAYIVLSAIFLSLGLWLTVPTANSPEARGPEQFYLIFGIGFGEVLMAVLTFVLGYFTVMKKILLAAILFAGFSLVSCAQEKSSLGLELRVVTSNVRYMTANDGQNSWEYRKDALSSRPSEDFS